MKKVLFFALVLAACPAFSQSEMEKQLQTQFVMAEDGDEIVLPAGKIALSNTLWLDGKSHITIRGAGEGKTILTFKNQNQGSEGMKITNAEAVTLRDFTIEDAKGDLIKTQHVKGMYFYHITAQWTGEPSKTNGSYALYPVQCENVRIQFCTAIGASDAGIYVGQSDSIVVSDCTARQNVAGIEIENSTRAWVFRNLATGNTGGILVFDLPDLLKKRGGQVQVYDNKILKNNYRNFAPKGNIVGKVPSGTGVMILAANHVEVFNNEIIDNKTASTAIVSYFITEIPIKDTLYMPYPSAISVHDNVYFKGKKNKRRPTFKNRMGLLFYLKFGRKVPHILYDGIKNPDWVDASGKLKREFAICIANNKNGTLANLHADRKFKHISRDPAEFRCD